MFEHNHMNVCILTMRMLLLSDFQNVPQGFQFPDEFLHHRPKASLKFYIVKSFY